MKLQHCSQAPQDPRSPFPSYLFLSKACLQWCRCRLLSLEMVINVTHDANLEQVAASFANTFDCVLLWLCSALEQTHQCQHMWRLMLGIMRLCNCHNQELPCKYKPRTPNMKLMYVRRMAQLIQPSDTGHSNTHTYTQSSTALKPIVTNADRQTLSRRMRTRAFR